MLLRITLIGLLILFVPTLADAQPRAVVELIEDDSEAFIKQLNNDGALDATKIRQEFRDVYSGVSSIYVTPFQRFASRIPGWSFPIVEKPELGQYRYLRFAWKRIDKPAQTVGIMIQLNSNGSWNQRYYAGYRSDLASTWGPMIQVDKDLPSEWTVVTRDLFKDFGSMTLTGFALTPMDHGVAGLFDHVYLGRTIKDLERASAEAFGKMPLKEPLTLLHLGNLWEDLAKGDVKVTSPAVRTLLAGLKESVTYLAKMLRGKPAAVDAKQIARWIDDLDNREFQVREAAFRALDKLGDAGIRFLQEARTKARSVEQRNRIDTLLKNRGIAHGALTGEQLRLVRAIRVVEWAGTVKALEALDTLVKEPPDGTVLADIRQARERLAKTLHRSTITK